MMRLATKTHLPNILTRPIIQYLHEQFTNINVILLPFHEWLHSLNTKNCLEQVFNSFNLYTHTTRLNRVYTIGRRRYMKEVATNRRLSIVWK